jgi:hypothetical protein
MTENERLYPVSEELFNRRILPVIEVNYIWKGRPPKVPHYKVFLRDTVYSENRLPVAEFA